MPRASAGRAHIIATGEVEPPLCGCNVQLLCLPASLSRRDRGTASGSALREGAQAQCLRLALRVGAQAGDALRTAKILSRSFASTMRSWRSTIAMVSPGSPWRQGDPCARQRGLDTPRSAAPESRVVSTSRYLKLIMSLRGGGGKRKGGGEVKGHKRGLVGYVN